MQRREFLHLLTAAGVAAATTTVSQAAWPQAPTSAQPRFDPAQKLRGVNLGGWLVLEKWLTPTVFAGLKAGDEFTLGEEMGGAAAAHLAKHRASFITEDDFAWIAARGLDAVRLPVGYWVLEAEAPYVAAPEVLDQAFAWAKAHDLGVLLDLHGAPGSQNGWDHSGRSGEMQWHTSRDNIDRTLEVLEAFAARYGDHPNLTGIELLNEPRYDMPLDVLKPFYQEAYARVRRHAAKERVAVVIHDAFRAFEWNNFMTEPEYSNVILDTHMYQCFDATDKTRNIFEQIERASVGRKKQIDAMNGQLWTIVGEWSLCLPWEAIKDLSEFERDAARRAFGGSQLLAYEASHGWYFWNYKTENSPEWSLRTCIERGWLPEKFA